MFDFLKIKRQQPHENTDDEVEPTQFYSTQRQNQSTEDLAKLVLSEVMRKNGIPRDWLFVESFEVEHRPGLKETHLQLVIERWSEPLLRYSTALQKQLLAGLDHFEPGVAHSKYVFSWRFSKDCAVPYASIPEGISWHVSTHRNGGQAAIKE